mgnify:CR=1 FL=1
MNNTLFKLSVIASVLLLTACNDSKNERPEINYKPQAINANVITQTEVVITDMLNAYDQNNEPLTFTLVTEPKFGTVVIAESGNYTYTPNLEVTGADSFEFVVSDGVNQSDIGMVNITIEALNVDFAAQVSKAFSQSPSDMPLSVNGRHYLNTEVETDFDELLVDF